MIHPPLLALSLLAVGGWAQKNPAPQPARPAAPAQAAALEAAGFDSKLVAADKLPADPAQREAFLRANKGEYDRFVAWRQDPALMFEAERKEPGSVQKALSRMEGFAKPEEVGLLRTRLLLAPRGVSAVVPEGAGFEGRPQGPGPGASATAAGAGAAWMTPAPPASPLLLTPTPGLRTSPPPGPVAPKTEPPKDDGGLVDDWVAAWCKVIGC